jgi:hypothetical protein
MPFAYAYFDRESNPNEISQVNSILECSPPLDQIGRSDFSHKLLVDSRILQNQVSCAAQQTGSCFTSGNNQNTGVLSQFMRGHG